MLLEYFSGEILAMVYAGCLLCIVAILFCDIPSVGITLVVENAFAIIRTAVN